VTFDSFSIFLHPVLVIDFEGHVIYSNDACEESFGLSHRQLRAKAFPEAFSFEPKLPFALAEITDRTGYFNCAFATGKKEGNVAVALEPIRDELGITRLVVSFYDSTVETRLMQKYQGERSQRESLEEEVLNQRADLLIANNQLQRKITQTEFLLKFYARTRFALETDAIARQFLQLACVELGFQHGFFFSYQERVWRLGSYYYPEIQKDHATKLQSEAQKSIVDPPFLRFSEAVGFLSEAMLKDNRLLDLYKTMGVLRVANGAVVCLHRDNQPIGEFHFLNYAHNQRIGESAMDMLRYMVDPVSLTFENAELYRASVTDELTQINNVRYFRIRLHNEIMRTRKDETPLALLMFDIDHFKSINDRYGHQVGDQAIRAMANALKMGVRGGDIVARYGGEEMAAILPGATLETALVVAERLRAHVAEIVVDSDQGPVQFTTSVGVSTLPSDATEMEALINCADQALYRAKREGRNRVIKF
jgi:diguanylate cyclase (GGDEF)-like protein